MVIHHELDPEELKSIIEEALNLNDNEQLFTKLTEISKAKKELNDLVEHVEQIEGMAKAAINAKAKQLYGNDWQTITGRGYKINRQFTGNVYVRNPDLPVAKKFIIVKESLDTKAIDLAIEANDGKLPKGIEINPTRGESIRILIK